MIQTSNPVSSARAQYLSVIGYARKFDGEVRSVLNPSWDAYPDTMKATIDLIEGGETAWDTPEFEKAVKSLLSGWITEGKLIRATLTAQWLLTTEPYSDTRQRLEAIAAGEFWKILDDWQLRASIVGSEKDFLYPLQLERIIHSRKYWAAYRTGTCALLRMPKRSA